MSPPAIGIDLGATHSCVAVFQNGVPTIIANENGNKSIPSYVTFTTPTDFVVGDAARVRSGKNTVFYSKCLIGLKFKDNDQLKDYIHEDLPSAVTVRNGDPYFQLNFNGRETLVSPTDVSSKVLARLKEIAESHLGCKIHEVVIAVPATFLHAQREATRAAALTAGFTSVELLHEPTAAATAYGVETDVNGVNILVFDLGAATLDVSVMSLQDNEFRVLGTSGMTRFGGIFFDRKIIEHVSEEFKRQHGRNLTDVENNRLRIVCARAKRDLDTATQSTIEIEGTGFKTTLTRDKFNQLNEPLFAQVIPSVREALENAKIDKSNIQRIMLVGGSSRIPRIKEKLSEFFGGKRLDSSSINPEEAVAHGAAVKAAILCGDFDDNEPSIVEIASHSLGIETIGGFMNAIITRSSTLPIEQTKMFTTAYDNQTVVKIKVFEGEEPQTKDNTYLGTFDLSGILPAARGVPSIEVTLELDTNGILHVSAVDKKAGKHGKIQIAVRKH